MEGVILAITVPISVLVPAFLIGGHVEFTIRLVNHKVVSSVVVDSKSYIKRVFASIESLFVAVVILHLSEHILDIRLQVQDLQLEDPVTQHYEEQNDGEDNSND